MLKTFYVTNYIYINKYNTYLLNEVLDGVYKHLLHSRKCQGHTTLIRHVYIGRLYKGDSQPVCIAFVSILKNETKCDQKNEENSFIQGNKGEKRGKSEAV